VTNSSADGGFPLGGWVAEQKAMYEIFNFVCFDSFL
jgi:hypothetical protein